MGNFEMMCSPQANLFWGGLTKKWIAASKVSTIPGMPSISKASSLLHCGPKVKQSARINWLIIFNWCCVFCFCVPKFQLFTTQLTLISFILKGPKEQSCLSYNELQVKCTSRLYVQIVLKVKCPKCAQGQMTLGDGCSLGSNVWGQVIDSRTSDRLIVWYQIPWGQMSLRSKSK